jgi:hypothetical protein
MPASCGNLESVGTANLLMERIKEIARCKSAGFFLLELALGLHWGERSLPRPPPSRCAGWLGLPSRRGTVGERSRTPGPRRFALAFFAPGGAALFTGASRGPRDPGGQGSECADPWIPRTRGTQALRASLPTGSIGPLQVRPAFG